MMVSRKAFRGLAAVALVVFVGSCAPSGEEYQLREDPEERRLAERRRRMNVRVLSGEGSTEELTPAAFDAALRDDCQDAAEALTGVTSDCEIPLEGTPSFAHECKNGACISTAALCLANRYMELGAALAPIEVGGFTVPPQSNATRVGFYERAAYLVQAALNVAGETLRQPYVEEQDVVGSLPGTYCSVEDLDTTISGVPLARVLIGNVGESVSLLREAVGEAVRRNIAAADAEPTRTPDPTIAHRAAWHDPFLSRARAAQLAYGSVSAGEAPLPYGLPESCALRPLTSRGATALQYVRSSGVSPAWVREEQSIDDFLTVGTSGPEIGVAERIQAVANPGDGAGGGMGFMFEPPQGERIAMFSAATGLSRADFVEARKYLRCELDAFPRDATDAEVGPYELPMYTAVRYGPTHGRGPERWVEVVRAEAEYEVYPPATWTDDRAMRGAAHAVDYARRLVSELSAVEANTEAADLLAEADDQFLGSIGTELSLTTSGRVETCSSEVSGDYSIEVTVLDDGIVPVSDYLIVVGSETLRCALDGTVDGLPCVLDDGFVRTFAGTGDQPEQSQGYARAVTKTYTTEPDPAGELGAEFVVRRHSGLVGRPPGGYELVGPIIAPPLAHLTTLESWESLCDAVPSSPTYREPTERAVTPDPQAPGVPEVGCEDIGEPHVPLEAELSDDGDRYETSWRRQIEIARAAADLADQLADQHVAQGLDVDGRAEAAQRELAALCGVNVDLTRLFETELTDQVSGPCLSGTGGGYCSDPHYRCIGHVCVADPLARLEDLTDDDRTQRILADCLGGIGLVEPTVALGTTPLCFWYKESDPSLLCDPAGVELAEGERLRCPYRAVGGTCATPTDLQEGYAIDQPTEYLGFFTTRDLGSGGPIDRTVDCGQHLRTLRSSAATPDEVREARAELVRSNWLTQEQATLAASRIGWAGYPGDRAVMRIDRAHEFYTTGDATRAESLEPGRWPCVGFPLPMGESCEGSQSLFCTQIDCSSVTERADANYRTARAATTLAIISGFGLSNLELPAVTPGHEPPEGATVPGATGRSDLFYLQGMDLDPIRLLMQPTGGWPSSDLDHGGRTYYLVDSSVTHGNGVRPWHGYASGLHIGAEESAHPYATSCSGPRCAIQLIGEAHSEEFEYYARRTHMLRFVNYGNDSFVWKSSTRAREAWVDGLWSGASGARPSPSGHEGPVARALGLGTPLPRDNVIPGLDEHTRVLEHPIAWVAWNAYHAEGNYARLFDTGDGAVYTGMHRNNVLDALELLCYANSSATDGLGCPEEPPTITSETEVAAARGYLQCLARDIEESAETTIVQNVPRVVVQAAQGGGAAIAPLEGEYGRAVAGAREVLLTLREQPRAIAAQLRGLEADLATFEIAVRQTDIRREIIDWHMAQEAINGVATCAEVAERNSSGEFGGGVARCAAAIANLAISFRVRDLEVEALDLQSIEHLIDFRRGMEARVDAMQRISAQVSLLVQQFNGHLATLNGAQQRGRALLANAMFHASTPGREHVSELPSVHPVNIAMRRRYTTGYERYQRAFWRASRAAVLARRAIEQRLAMSFDDMDDLLLLEEHPRHLVRGSCEFEGIDYERIRNLGWTDGDGIPRTSYADGYIGDYVRDLQAVVDSYPYRYPYTDGSDTIVLSLRDDGGVRGLCPVATYSLLRGTADMRGSRAWQFAGCDPEADEEETCIGIRELREADIAGMDALPGPRAALLDPNEHPAHAISGYRITFGNTDPGGALTAESRLFQTLEGVPGGLYRLSWYGRVVDTGPSPEDLVYLAGADPSPSDILEIEGETLATGWYRYVRFYDVSSTRTLEVGIAPGVAEDAEVDLGGLMLERIERGDAFPAAGDITAMTLMSAPVIFLPRPFLGTDDEGLARMYACEDVSGIEFRSRGWTNGCDNLCSGGFNEVCSEERSAEPFCYRQREFFLRQEDIAAGRAQLAGTGFAYGNFNYRIERIGVNVVGTHPRRCEASETPATCYASGTIPYSLYHESPYHVINHRGDPYTAPLFVGRVDHARALAAERYLTNPLSSADSALIEPTMRDDFHGRPLDGRFVLRLWDMPGVDFSGVEDIQIVIQYRYWSRSRTPSGD